MISHFIEGYDRKYSIREDGNVILHRKSKSPRSKLRDEFCWEGVILNKSISENRVFVTLVDDHKNPCQQRILPLMVKYFNLKPPSKDFKYIPYCIDGDVFNTSFNNIGWKLSLYRDPTNFFYDAGELIKIKCIKCGSWKNPCSYKKKYKGNKKYLFASTCFTCSNTSARIKLGDGYIRRQLIHSLGFSKDQITPELIDAYREKIKLERLIKRKS